MTHQAKKSRPFPRLLLLTASLSAALGATISAASTDSLSIGTKQAPYPPGPSAREGAAAHERAAAPTPHSVTTCDDDISNPGSLRAQIAAAMSGDMIDLSSLMCSTITLSAPITIFQDSLYLYGPLDRTVAIDGAGHNRIFAHAGSGKLGISYLTVQNGYYTGALMKGGCVYSHGDVLMKHATITECYLRGGVEAEGGGIFTKGSLTMEYGSAITNSEVTSSGAASVYGGGAYSDKDLTLSLSTLDHNSALSLGGMGYGGGAVALGNVTIGTSTLSNNHAARGGALVVMQLNVGKTAQIIDSTVSGNTADTVAGGVDSHVPLTVQSSTIAFNKQGAVATKGGGLYMHAEPLTLRSSIIADNVSGGAAGDLDGFGNVPVTATDNVVVATPFIVPGAISDCPKLQALSNNGGPTLTHALMHSSPSIDVGNAPPNLAVDQRLKSRWQGVKPDIGAVEWQPGEVDDRISVNGFDGLCDQ